ncbi:MAG: hypothetical protein Q9201_002297 [Fulgogasparrea decipioides]
MGEYYPDSTLLTSAKPTKAITTTSKPDPARPDLIFHTRAGYLSEDQVEERYKVLSKDTKKTFEKLEIEFEERRFDSVSDALGWNAYLSIILKTPDLVDLFTKWMFFNRPKHPRTIDLKDFRDKLSTANWRLKNEEYDRVFHLMWNIGMNQPTKFLLQQLNRNILAVEVDPGCLTPQEPLHDSFEAYDIIDTNLINILGLRYRTGHATKDMIVAPFGRILSCSHPVSKVISDFPWTVSEYALVLEILRDGVGGDFYFVNNVTEVEDDTINSKPILCGKGPFTVGKVKTPLGLGLLGNHPRHWLSLHGSVGEFSHDEELELDILSTSKPEIVMTGIRESRIGKEIVGLYDQE